MSAPAAAPRAASPSTHARKVGLAGLVLGALGVVYGDIGTSPLYAVKECFGGEYGLAPTQQNVLGVLSLVFWALFLVIVVKYLTFMMRADNRGEGGILALIALLRPSGRASVLVTLGLFGAALLYGDGIITPAISVLSAVEGLEIATPALAPWVVPLTVVILAGLFLVQRHGTARVGAMFGPVTLIWFASIALAGLPWVVSQPAVLSALSPHHAIRFIVNHGFHGFFVLGSVVLCITGGEALYADMGHFGPRPIRQTWFAIVFPALVLNYFGQGALLLRAPTAAANPFYALVPNILLYPVVTIATAATVVASQALISGAYSLTQQAMQLGYFPRVTVVHTSKEAEGQIYIPEINWALLVACVWLVLAYKNSS